MLIAKEKKAKNIIEYIIYMFQIEDLIRSFDLDIQKIDQHIISQFKVDNLIVQEMQAWYEGLIQQMKLEKIQVKGHFQFIRNLIFDLNDLHLYLIQKQNQEYLQYYSWAKSHITELQKKSKEENVNEIEAVLNGLYGVLMLKLQKRELSDATKESVEYLSKLMALLNQIYFKIAKGEMELNKV
ncbi:MAG: DUF4924 family protein [Bacteroidales bacterium]|nr:DUF4924 family protein [Bacteroidales bacterium]